MGDPLSESAVNRNLTILIAEENPDEALLFKLALRNAKINNPVQVVKDGSEAIDYLSGAGQFGDRRQFPFPSFVMLDVRMPRLGGFDVLAWLREHPKYAMMPTIVLTNSRLPDDVRRAYELGANSYIVKPHDLKEFISVLRTVYEYWAICEKPELVSAQPDG